LGACAALALLWVVSRPADAGLSGILLTGLGLVSIAGGLWLRRTEWGGTGRSGAASSTTASLILIAYGLAAMTTSLYVLAAAGFACLAYWLNGMLATEQEPSGAPTWTVMRESVVLVGVVLALVLFYHGRGIMPFR
jgi:undecaprenyl-diphosphatase